VSRARRARAFATTHPGLEAILAGELERMGLAPASIERSGVEFEAGPGDLWRANLLLRTAGRVLVRVAAFHAAAFHELERHAKRVPWERFLPADGAVHCRVTTKKSALYHERAIVERLEAAIRTTMPNVSLRSGRGEVELEERDVAAPVPVQRFVVRLYRDECVVSADSSGPLLHRRGYRLRSGKAPLRETLAAGLLLAAGWDGAVPLIDPMCGSGTIPIEAALLARRMPPGWGRRFAFEAWPEFEPEAYARLRDHLATRLLARAPAPIMGADRDAGAITLARANAERAGVAGDVEWRQQTISALDRPTNLSSSTSTGSSGWIVTNPPYGTRLGEKRALRNLYAQFGNVLRRSLARWRVAMVSADRMLESQVGLAWNEAARSESGGLEVRLVTAEVRST